MWEERSELYDETIVSHAGWRLRPWEAWWVMARWARVVIVSLVVIVPSKSRMMGRGNGGVVMVREADDFNRIVMDFRVLGETCPSLNIDEYA